MTTSIEQYDRYAKLLIKSDNVVLDLSTLAFKFETSFALLSVPKVLKVRVYNVAPRTIQIILNEGLQVELIAGYVGQFSTIFSGQIRQVSVGKENGVDSFVDIQASDNDGLFTQGFVSTVVSAGSSATQRLYQVNNSLNYSPEQLEVELKTKDDSTKLPRGRVYHGAAKSYFSEIAAQKGATFHVENGKIVVLDQNLMISDEKVVINRFTGMIGLPQQTIQGIQVKCLLNPTVRLGGIIQLDNSSIQIQQQGFAVKEDPKWELNINPLNKDGNYKVLSITHEGIIRGTPWYTNIICFDVTHPTPAQIPFTGI